MAISLRSISIPPGNSTKAQGPPALLPLMPGCATQAEFRTTIYMEQRRSERSGRPFLLILLNAEAIGEADIRAASFAAILATLHASVRETDKLGWYTTASVLGLLFRDVGSAGPGLVHDLVNKVSAAVTSAVHAPAADAIQLTACLFPQPADRAAESGNLSSCSKAAERGVQSVLKRAMDIAGSLLGLLLLSPLFLLIAAAVKCSSPAYDILLLLSSFRAEHRSIAETSLASKIADYLAAGRCILAFGPSYAENIRYAQRHGCAEVVTTSRHLRSALLRLLHDPGRRRDLGARAWEFARERHDQRRNVPRLWRALFEANSAGLANQFATAA